MHNTKYVVIISSEYDQSTTNVVDWLRFYDQKYIILNENTNVELSYLRISNRKAVEFELNIINKIENRITRINNLNICSVWYRRGNFFISYRANNPLGSIQTNKDINKYFDEFNAEQRIELGRFLSKYLSCNYRNLNRIEDNFLNKLEALETARKCGFPIPDSYIYQDKNKLNFTSSLITKSLSYPIYFRLDDKSYGALTTLIDSKKRRIMPDRFSPSFFQKNIIKAFELRIFFIEDVYYSMAIFSQSDSRTMVDFRNYNELKPNRFVPYTLPKQIETKLTKLMKELKLSSGSVDIIVDDRGHYYFLEVNPVGQYDMVSVPCNYYLHKKIAEYLSK